MRCPSSPLNGGASRPSISRPNFTQSTILAMMRPPVGFYHNAEESVPDRPRVLFLGAFGEFSFLPLAALLDAGLPVCAVVVPPSGPADASPPAVRRVEPAPIQLSPLTLTEAPANRSI